VIDQKNLKPPNTVAEILSETTKIGFQMGANPLAASLFRTLAASKPGGNFLELGTGTGISTAWLLDGMDKNSKIITVDNDSAVVSIAQKYLGNDQRISFQIEDAGEFLEQIATTGQQFDFIFADAWAGKYTHLEVAIEAIKPGGLYLVDDMLPHPNWSDEHKLRAAALITELEDKHNLLLTKLNWASGIIIAVKPLVTS
jgi:predicted O-methyltransferase YrrM